MEEGEDDIKSPFPESLSKRTHKIAIRWGSREPAYTDLDVE